MSICSHMCIHCSAYPTTYNSYCSYIMQKTLPASHHSCCIFTKPWGSVCHRRPSRELCFSLVLLWVYTFASVYSSLQVCVYSMVEDRLLYDVKLTHPVSTLDVWNNYILVGSFPVQLFEMKTDRLRRIVVIDSEDDTHSTNVRMLLYNYLSLLIQ